MKEIIFNGIPVLIREKERPPRTIRINIKKRAVKYKPFADLDSRQKQAINNYINLGCDPERKKEAGEAAGYSDKAGVAVRAMDRLLARLPIIKDIEDQCMALYGKGRDKKVAQVLAEQLEAVHPLAKGKKKDNLAILGAAKEINKLSDNYPAKKVDVREMGVHLVFGAADIKAAKEYRELTDEDS